MDAAIDTNEVQDRFVAARVAHLATITAANTAHVVPCCFAMYDGQIVSAVDGKPKSTLALKRLANIAAHPNISMIVDHYDDDWSQLWWVRVDGIAHTLHRGTDYEAAVDSLAAKYPIYRTDRPEGSVIAITPTTWRSWSAQ